LNKLDEGDWHGLILAVAGLRRLGLERRIREVVDFDIMLPAVGQGALGVVCSSNDEELYAVLRDVLHDPGTGIVTAAERALLRRLEGGCSVPIGAYGRMSDGNLILEGCVTSLDGTRNYRDRVSGKAEDAERLGLELAERILSEGAGAILKEIRGE
jgi:hydroxymethylbilane synthase